MPFRGNLVSCPNRFRGGGGGSKWSGSSNGVRADPRKECGRRQIRRCAENCIPKCQVGGRQMESIAVWTRLRLAVRRSGWVLPQR